ncbi:hypothetical protein LDENG_00164410 [Lucifuga dentata]|nr:hypothetical protein LDENG_00164410 [Lucifuga dentata]
MSPRTNCFGPFNTVVPIPYDEVSLNHGGGYNPALGVFTAPQAGLYSFSFMVYSKLVDYYDKIYYKVKLMRNGEMMVSMWDNRKDSEDSSTQMVLLPLQIGGQVYVELEKGRQLCGDSKGKNTFSGSLIYANLDE